MKQCQNGAPPQRGVRTARHRVDICTPICWRSRTFSSVSCADDCVPNQWCAMAVSLWKWEHVFSSWRKTYFITSDRWTQNCLVDTGNIVPIPGGISRITSLADMVNCYTGDGRTVCASTSYMRAAFILAPSYVAFRARLDSYASSESTNNLRILYS